MAKKTTAKEPPQIVFKTTPELKAAIEDLARLSRCKVSDFLNRLCAELVAANKERIENFRRQAAQELKMPPPFATPTTATAEGDDTHEEKV